MTYDQLTHEEISKYLAETKWVKASTGAAGSLWEKINEKQPKLSLGSMRAMSTLLKLHI